MSASVRLDHRSSQSAAQPRVPGCRTRLAHQGRDEPRSARRASPWASAQSCAGPAPHCVELPHYPAGLAPHWFGLTLRCVELPQYPPGLTPRWAGLAPSWAGLVQRCAGPALVWRRQHLGHQQASRLLAVDGSVWQESLRPRGEGRCSASFGSPRHVAPVRLASKGERDRAPGPGLAPAWKGRSEVAHAALRCRQLLRSARCVRVRAARARRSGSSTPRDRRRSASMPPTASAQQSGGREVGTARPAQPIAGRTAMPHSQRRQRAGQPHPHRPGSRRAATCRPTPSHPPSKSHGSPRHLGRSLRFVRQVSRSSWPHHFLRSSASRRPTGGG